MIVRKPTRSIKVRNLVIGNGAPVVIQSMTNTQTCNIDETLKQIHDLANVGCEIVRISIPDKKSLDAFTLIRQQTDIPLVADIHFQHRLAIAAIEAGADKVRINPGNIGSQSKVKAVVDAARQNHVPIRIGVNSGSLDKEKLKKYKRPTSPALVESALEYIAMMEEWNFQHFILSIKATDVPTTIAASRLLSQNCNYPQHIGITEAGTVRTGTIRSSVGIGTLLTEGIGDTLRVSLSGDPIEEIFVCKEILKSLGLRSGPMVIACPTCARTQVEVISLAQKVETMVANIEAPVKIAVMGCIVNGPGEAREADIGITGSSSLGIIFMQGQEIARVSKKDLLNVFKQYLFKIIKEKYGNESP